MRRRQLSHYVNERVESDTIVPSNTHEHVRALLRRLFGELREVPADEARRDETRVVLAQLLDRVTLDPATATARLHYQIGSATGNSVATPRGFEPLLQP